MGQDGNIYSVITIPGYSWLQEEGMPQLPVKIVKLIIPAGEEAVEVDCTKGKSRTISLNYPVMPVQKPIPASVNFEGNEFVPPNKKVYLQDANYPDKSARILRTNHIHGNFFRLDRERRRYP